MAPGLRPYPHGLRPTVLGLDQLRIEEARGQPAAVTDQQETKMPVDTIDLDPEIKAKIDNMSREELEAHLREEDPTSELRQGVAGEYFEERFKGATGMTSDDFNRQMRLEAEKDDDEELGEVDDEEDQDDGEDAPVLG